MALKAAQGFPSSRYEVTSILQELRNRRVCTRSTREIDDWVIPIMEELILLDLDEKEHPLFRKLVNWLSDPLRSAGEFIYVAWPLDKHVCDIKGYALNGGCLGNVLCEALAIRCPILEGLWEHAAWIVLEHYENYDYGEFGFASELFMNWIIQVIGNPDICPNPYLRIRLLFCIKWMSCGEDLVVRSLLSACSALKVENGDECLILIYNTLYSATENKFVLSLDQQLSAKLQDMKISRLSAILHDNSNRICMNPNRYIDPIELQGLTAILKAIAGHTEQLSEMPFFLVSYVEMHGICRTLDLVIFIFIKSCQRPPLIEIASSCIIDVLALGLLFYSQGNPTVRESLYDIGVSSCESILINLCIKEKIQNGLPGISSIASSPVCQVIIQKYKIRLNELRIYLYPRFVKKYPVIHSLLHYDTLSSKIVYREIKDTVIQKL